MDKTEFEQYGYLADDNEMDSSQLLVVQEDGTFLCFNRPIQYVTQEDEVKNVLGAQSNEYDSQQLYVEGENSSELISDQFVLQGGEKHAYENNYLLQDNEISEEVPMEEDVQYKEVTDNEETVDEADGEAGDDKYSGDCTEITLNDEQYQLLEQKGWILLESNDKTFLLDSSGLHDITEDEKLIMKLKLELQEDEEDEVSSTIKETKKEYVKIKIEPHSADNKMLEHVMSEDVRSESNKNITSNNEGTLYTVEEEVISEADITPIEAEHDYVKLSSVKDSAAKRQNDTVRIKTKFSFKDIPPEIVLGKFNGKKLIARVTKTERLVKRLGTNINVNNTDLNPDQPDFSGLPDSKFEKLICEAVRSRIDCGVTDVTAAEIVVVQLSRVAAFRPALMERGLIITKVIIQELENGELYSESTPSLVTGRAVRDNMNNCRFKFMPEMLWKLATANDFQNEDYCRENNKYDFLHIHIRETKATDGIIRISITLNKRNIPLHLFKAFEVDDEEIYMCSSCDNVFDTEDSLRFHQEMECRAEENEPIDMEEAANAYTVINSSRGKQYACNVCNIVYTNLPNCQKHIQTHIAQDEQPLVRKAAHVQVIRADDANKHVDLYKCTMCKRAFFDLPTLSKHIVSKHIKQINSP